MKNKNFFALIIALLSLSVFQNIKAQNRSDSLSLLIEKSSGTEKTKYLNALANELLNSDLNKAISTATIALEKAEDLNAIDQKAIAARIIADAWYYKNDFYKAIDFYKISAEAEKESKGPQSEKYAERLGDVGYCYKELSLYDYADDYYQKALSISQNINNVEETANNLNNLGHVNFAWGNYDKAISFFSRALILDKERKINEYISIDFNNIGKVYFAWKKYDRALEYYDLALEKAVISGNRSMQAIRLSNIGQVYEAMNNYDTALDYLNRALEMDKMLGHNRKVGIRLSNIGMVFVKQGKYDDALRNFNRALEIFKNSGLLDSQAITYNNLGELMCRLNNYQNALGYYNQSLNISHRIGLKPQELRSLHNISTVYENLGEYQNSLDFFKRFSALNDSIFNKEKHKQIAEFETRYETEKKEKQNILLKHEAKIQRDQKVLYIFLGAAMLVVAVLFIFLFITKRKSLIQSKKLNGKEIELHRLEMEKKAKEKENLQQVLFAEEEINKLQQEKIKQKNRELSTSTLHILNKNEVLGNIRVFAKNALNDNDSGQKSCLTKIIDEIERNTNLDEQWNQFKLHFESVHKGFFEKLTGKFPNITQNDLRLCAYLKMNLSTKEIAQMLNISIESVNTKRYRLRKKLNLRIEENLATFIGTF